MQDERLRARRKLTALLAIGEETTLGAAVCNATTGMVCMTAIEEVEGIAEDRSGKRRWIELDGDPCKASRAPR